MITRIILNNYRSYKKLDKNFSVKLLAMLYKEVLYKKARLLPG